MSTIVVCLDRTDDIGRKAGIETPIVGWNNVHQAVTDIGLADPEDSSVNSILESLRITQSLRDRGERADVVVVSGASDSMVRADRAVAQQLDELLAEYDPDSAIVVIDSAEDERLIPIVESRLPVDSVNRVVVRQARDLESTYYLLKQFLADEELRQTTLVPIGMVLIVFPILAYFASVAFAGATITAVIGLFLVYKGFGIQEYLDRLFAQVRESLYSGQVSVVTYVIGAGLATIGIFVGILEVSELTNVDGILIPAMQFAYGSVPWMIMAALAASAGRLLDEYLNSDDSVRYSYLNLPFFVIAVGLVLRGFAGFFLERETLIDPFVMPALSAGPLTIDAIELAPGERLALLVVAGVLVSLIGVQVSSYIERSRVPSTDPDLDQESG